MVWQGSNAAFSSKTHNDGNNWATGSVGLTNDAGEAMFSVKDVVPDQTGSKCIVVTSNSSVPGVVKLYAGELAANGLEPYIKLTVQQGSGGTFDNCAGAAAAGGNPAIPAFTGLLPLEATQTLADLIGTPHTSYGTGILPWTTAGTEAGESRTYKFSWVFDTGTLSQAGIDALQGKSVSINFHWELQNT
jgi:hypothetical protein